MREVATQFRPTSHRFDLLNSSAIYRAEKELREKACLDTVNSCHGFFPDHFEDAAEGLPESAAFATAFPGFMVKNMNLTFSWLRLSLVPHTPLAPFHLDGDSKTGFTDEPDPDRRAWRLVLNLDAEHDREFGFSPIDPWSVPLRLESGYYRAEAVNTGDREVEVIPHRRGRIVHGVLACVSQLLHVGVEGTHGSFLASYGFEEPR